MASYFSSLTSSSAISNLSTRLNSLRRAITLGDEADDPDDENCSHISNVLRAYYTEKGRPYPGWLPPDPKNPNPTPPTRVIATSQIQPGQMAGGPGGSGAGPYGRGSSSGGLGDLWGDSGSPPSVAPQTASLRRGRSTPGFGSGAPLTGAASAPPGSVPASLASSASSSPMPSPGLGGVPPGAGARPLPSQRAGSYQTAPAGGPERAASSAQERLRARLQGGRSPSPGMVDPSARKPVGGMAPRWGSR